MSDTKFVKPSKDEIHMKLQSIRILAETVTDKMKNCGDHYTYEGGMNSVESLKEALSDYQGLWYRLKK